MKVYALEQNPKYIQNGLNELNGWGRPGQKLLSIVKNPTQENDRSIAILENFVKKYPSVNEAWSKIKQAAVFMKSSEVKNLVLSIESPKESEQIVQAAKTLADLDWRSQYQNVMDFPLDFGQKENKTAGFMGFGVRVPKEGEYGYGLNEEAMKLLKQYGITNENLFQYDNQPSRFPEIYDAIQQAKSGNIEALKAALESRFGKKKWFGKVL